jgi:hypothetical protein
VFVTAAAIYAITKCSRSAPTSGWSMRSRRCSTFIQLTATGHVIKAIFEANSKRERHVAISHFASSTRTC